MGISQLNKGSGLLANLGIYTVSNLLNAAIPFVLLPILTRYLNPSDYGILSSINALINVVIPIVGLNLMSALQVVYIKETMELNRYISTGVMSMLFLTLIFSALLWGLAPWLTLTLKIPYRFLVFIAVYAFYQNLVETLLSIWRVQNKAFAYGVFRISRTLVELIISLSLIVLYQYNFEGAILGLIYSYGIAAVIAVFILYRKYNLNFHWDRFHFIHLLKYGGNLIPHVLGGMILVYADKLVIAHFMGQSENGIYAVGFTVAQAIGLFQNSFNQAWSPWAMHQLKSNDGQKLFDLVKWTYWYFLILLILTIMFYWISPLIFSVLGDQFERGVEMVLYIALGFAFNGMYKMISVYYFYFEKTRLLSMITLITAVLNIVLLIFWVPLYGYFGASLALLASFFFQFVFTWILSTQFIKMPWLLKR